MTSGTTIMHRAGIILQDMEHERWPLAELCHWINEAMLAIVLAKPSALTETRVFTLAKGTLQSVTAISGSPAPLALLDIKRNILSTSPDLVGGRAIRATSGALLDAQAPDWHNPASVPWAPLVRQFIFDEQSPLTFYVYPGNDGTGKVEGVLSVTPTPLEPTGPAGAEDSYGATLPLQEPYAVPILDFVLYRAFSKDDTGAQPGRASFHYGAFASAVGLKVQVEGASSPNSRRGRP